MQSVDSIIQYREVTFMILLFHHDGKTVTRK